MPFTIPDEEDLRNADPADISKGAGIGIAKGVTRILGIPGAIDGGADHIQHALFDWLGGTHTPMPAPSIYNWPTAAQLQDVIEYATDTPWYAPSTVPGQDAEWIGKYIPTAVLFGGRDVARSAGRGILAAMTGGVLDGMLAGLPDPMSQGIDNFVGGQMVKNLGNPTVQPGIAAFWNMLSADEPSTAIAPLAPYPPMNPVIADPVDEMEPLPTLPLLPRHSRWR